MANPRLAAGIALVAGVAAVSWSAILVRWCEAPSLGIAFYRLLFSASVLLPWGLSDVRRESRSTGWLALAAGAFLAIHFGTWISSLQYTSVASSVVLVSMHPVFTAILSPLLLREKPGPGGVVAVLACLSGTVLLAGADLGTGGKALLGDALAVLGALTASLYLMIGRKLRNRIPFLKYLFLVYGTAAAFLGVAAFIAGARIVGYPAGTWFFIILMAAGPNLMGHSLFNWSVRRLRALTVNLAMLGEPVLATIYAAMLFDELPGLPFYLGAGMIAVGILLAAREERTTSVESHP